MTRFQWPGDDFRAFVMAFGAIIGVGWITALGLWLTQAGAYGAAIGMLLGGLLILPITRCYDHLHKTLGSDGGEIGQVSQIIGATGAFSAAWALLLAFWAVCAFEAVSVAWIAGEVFADLSRNAGQPKLPLSDMQIGIFAAALISVAIARGANIGLRLQNAMTVMLIGVSLFLVCAGFYQGDARNWNPEFVGGTDTSHWSGILSIFVTAPFWFAGFNAAAQVRQGDPDSSRSRPGSVMYWSVVAAIGFYVLIILSASMAAPRQELLTAELPAKVAFEHAIPVAGGGTLVLVAGLLGLVTTWLAVALAAVQVTLKLAGMGVFGDWMRRRPRLAVANLALFLVTAIALLSGRNLIFQAMHLVGICFAFVFLLVSFSSFKLADKLPEMASSASRTTALLATIAALSVLAMSLAAPFADAGATIGPAVTIACVWALLGGIVRRAGQSAAQP